MKAVYSNFSLNIAEVIPPNGGIEYGQNKTGLASNWVDACQTIVIITWSKVQRSTARLTSLVFAHVLGRPRRCPAFGRG